MENNELYAAFYGERAYLDLIEFVAENGDERIDRTGIGTKSITGVMLRFNLQEGFPLLTTKRVAWKSVLSELLWFLKGYTNVRYLIERGNRIWNEWAFKNWVESDNYNGPDMTNFGVRYTQDEEFRAVFNEQMEIFKERILVDDAFAAEFGELGDVYGKHWRAWEGEDGVTVDQLENAINDIKNNPTSRRILITSWNPYAVLLKTYGLPPCHYVFQFTVTAKKFLNLKFEMRSNDLFLGLPFNIASYAALLHIVARECGLEVGELIYTGADAHVYLNHMEQVAEQVARDIRPMPQLVIHGDKPWHELDMDDFEIVGYEPHPTIKADVAV